MAMAHSDRLIELFAIFPEDDPLQLSTDAISYIHDERLYSKFISDRLESRSNDRFIMLEPDEEEAQLQNELQCAAAFAVSKGTKPHKSARKTKKIEVPEGDLIDFEDVNSKPFESLDLVLEPGKPNIPVESRDFDNVSDGNSSYGSCVGDEEFASPSSTEAKEKNKSSAGSCVASAELPATEFDLLNSYFQKRPVIKTEAQDKKERDGDLMQRHHKPSQDGEFESYSALFQSKGAIPKRFPNEGFAKTENTPADGNVGTESQLRRQGADSFGHGEIWGDSKATERPEIVKSCCEVVRQPQENCTPNFGEKPVDVISNRSSQPIAGQGTDVTDVDFEKQFYYVIPSAPKQTVCLPSGTYLVLRQSFGVPPGAPVLAHPEASQTTSVPDTKGCPGLVANHEREVVSDQNSVRYGFIGKTDVDISKAPAEKAKSPGFPMTYERKSEQSVKSHNRASPREKETNSDGGTSFAQFNSLLKSRQQAAPKVNPLTRNDKPTADTLLQGTVVKINTAQTRNQVFCNAPLQTLKKETGDSFTPGSSYGLVLKNIADEFKCTRTTETATTSTAATAVGNDIQQIKTDTSDLKKLNSSESHFEMKINNDSEVECLNSNLNQKLGKLESKSVCQAPKVSETSNMGDRFSREPGSLPNIATKKRLLEKQYLQIIKLCPEADPVHLRKKVEECGGDDGLYASLVEEQVSRCAEIRKQESLIEEEFVLFVAQLPSDCDTDYVQEKWMECVGDEKKIKLVIQEEQLKGSLRDISRRLRTAIPDMDPQYREAKVREFVGDDAALEKFIKEHQHMRLMDAQYERMLMALPDQDPVELRQECDRCNGNETLVSSFIEKKKEELRAVEERNNQLININFILPDADPGFLRSKLEELNGSTDDFNDFVCQLLESQDYPRIQEDDPAERKKAHLWTEYIDNFDVKEFLARVSDPEKKFAGPNGHNSQANSELAIKFLQSRYPAVSREELEMTYKNLKMNLVKTCTDLDARNRPVQAIDASLKKEKITEDFLQEVTFINHRREIRNFMREAEELRSLEVEEARLNNLLLKCLCCFEDEVLAHDVVTCPDGHIFCKNCILKYIETKLGDGCTKFSCITNDCKTEFSLVTLETILPKSMFVKMSLKKQLEEVTEAHVPGLESCPSCTFAYIPPPEDKIFSCQNPDCLKETCRKCGEESHVPRRCEEVERPKDVEVRKGIEEKMTEALLRTCPKCTKKFIKEDGCNKMTCSCGAMMCYVCRQPVADYSHFNGQGGSNFHLCPLFSQNKDLHITAVQSAGVAAKNEALRENPDLHLVHDPTTSMTAVPSYK